MSTSTEPGSKENPVNCLILIAESALVEIKIQLKMPEKDKTADHPVGPDGKKLKPCCACPETKKVRDECIMEKVSRAEKVFQELILCWLCRERRTVDISLKLTKPA